jgi:hypothetical protein
VLDRHAGMFLPEPLKVNHRVVDLLRSPARHSTFPGDRSFAYCHTMMLHGAPQPAGVRSV